MTSKSLSMFAAALVLTACGATANPMAPWVEKNSTILESASSYLIDYNKNDDVVWRAYETIYGEDVDPLVRGTMPPADTKLGSTMLAAFNDASLSYATAVIDLAESKKDCPTPECSQDVDAVIAGLDGMGKEVKEAQIGVAENIGFRLVLIIRTDNVDRVEKATKAIERLLSSGQ